MPDDDGPKPVRLDLREARAIDAVAADRDRLSDVIDRAADELRKCYSITIGDRDGETRGLYRAIGIALDILAEADPGEREGGDDG